MCDVVIVLCYNCINVRRITHAHQGECMSSLLGGYGVWSFDRMSEASPWWPLTVPVTVISVLHLGLYHVKIQNRGVSTVRSVLCQDPVGGLEQRCHGEGAQGVTFVFLTMWTQHGCFSPAKHQSLHNTRPQSQQCVHTGTLIFICREENLWDISRE